MWANQLNSFSHFSLIYLAVSASISPKLCIPPLSSDTDNEPMCEFIAVTHPRVLLNHENPVIELINDAK